MSQTPASILSALREAWDGQTVTRQWFKPGSMLSRFQQVQGSPIGKQLQVAVWGDLNSGGYTTTSVAGGSANTAGNQTVKQAIFTLIQHLFPISIEVGAINMSAGQQQSLISAKNLEIEGAINASASQCERQLATDGSSIVAQCATGGASTTVQLTPSPSGAAWGYDAIVREWLRPGARVSVGTTANAQSLAANQLVSAIAENPAAPTMTIPTSISTTQGTHFVFINNPNSATAPAPEINGIRLIGSTSAFGGLDPTVGGQEFWTPALRDTTTTAFSLDLALSLNRAVLQKTDLTTVPVWTGLKQMQNFYSLLQNQVRYPGDMKLGAGNAFGSDGPEWNNMAPRSFKQILDSDWWHVPEDQLIRVTGSIEEPTWFSKIGGDGDTAGIWHQGATDFVDQLFYAFQVGTRQRNGWAGATALTA